ncbi:WXG100 family type VII secretion target [Amycolatopsis sp. YIM 10]|uniref:WXG100 family type VII secretion target n=1 Tax=Amycolatopsis sp. YIM 10 TaxID=2653857 RepID=UPI00128FD732|nr:hypothetical protein [Amycolatopsis sp. YIM 10]QFU85746.1 hypothetical protein YIM_02610 [Amycolatopsis sp. YIM 10]
MAPQDGSNVPLGDNSSTVDIVESARGRTDGPDIGDDRAITNPPNWQAQESQQLYEGATVNNDPGTAEATSQVWSQHSKDLTQAANDLYNAISELGAAWVGQGAGAAQGTLVAIANSSSTASQAASTMSTRLAQQAAAAAEVKKMPAPKQFDPQKQTEAMLAGGPAAMVADMKAQSDAADEVKAQQVAFFNRYTQAMSEVDSTTPSFGPESLGLKPFTGTGPSGLGLTGVSGGVPSVGGASVTGPYGGYSGDYAGSGSPGLGSSSSAAAPGASVSSATTQAGYAPGQGVGVGTGVGAGAAPTAPPPAAPTGNPAAALGAAGLGGAAGLAGGRALSSGNRSGATRSAASETGAAAQQAPNSAASATPQNAGVVSPGGTIGGQGAPPMGMGGMGGMGGAHGAQAQEEEEHTHASFLIEPDPDDAFGANEATPPPVIGAWTDDEDR